MRMTIQPIFLIIILLMNNLQTPSLSSHLLSSSTCKVTFEGNLCQVSFDVAPLIQHLNSFTAPCARCHVPLTALTSLEHPNICRPVAEPQSVNIDVAASSCVPEALENIIVHNDDEMKTSPATLKQLLEWFKKPENVCAYRGWIEWGNTAKLQEVQTYFGGCITRSRQQYISTALLRAGMQYLINHGDTEWFPCEPISTTEKYYVSESVCTQLLLTLNREQQGIYICVDLNKWMLCSDSVSWYQSNKRRITAEVSPVERSVRLKCSQQVVPPITNTHCIHISS